MGGAIGGSIHGNIHDAPTSAHTKNWWQADKGEVSTVAQAYVQEVDRIQFFTFDRFVKLEAMYDVAPRTNIHNNDTQKNRSLGIMTENVIASNIDTVVAQIAATDVRAEFMTDDADWDHQRTSKMLAFYADALSTTYSVGSLCRAAFKSCALKGTGVIKVWRDGFNQIRVERVLIDNIVVDEMECRSGRPRQMHYRDFFDAEDLKAQYPQFAEQIEAARGRSSSSMFLRMWGGYRPFKENEVVVVESWRLPIGPKGHANYVAGRHCITIDGADLLDETWDKPFFPFAIEKWEEPERGFYGIGLAERIAGIQNALNKRNWQINLSLDRAASPIMYVNQIDAKLSVQTVTAVGQVSVYKGALPQTPNPPIVSGEMYQSRNDLKAAASELSGVSRMASQAVKPSGVDSAVGLREYRDQTTQRFATQENGFEQIWLDVILLILDCCKDLGASAPVMMHRTKYGAEKIEWKTVDMGDLRIQIKAASTMSQTPAGRQQAVVEMAQAGVISQDEARRLMDHPDIESAMSLYTEAIDDAEHTIWMIESGEDVMPEPYQNIPVLQWRAQMRYLRIKNAKNCPEEILEAMRNLIVNCANILNPPAPPMQMGAPVAGSPTAPALPAGPAPGGPGGYVAPASAPTTGPAPTGVYAPMAA